MQAEYSTPSERPRRGRPRSFDLEKATAAALHALWTKGYEASSVEELGKITGLGPSSLYAAFGNKRGVLEAALTRYDRDRDVLLATLEHGSEGLADLRRFLEQIRRSTAEPGTPGCFMVNTATEVAPRDDRIAAQTNRYRERVRDGIAAAFGRAITRGEIQSVDVMGHARVVQATLYGALVAARAGAADEALAIIDALERQLERLVILTDG